MAHRFDATMKDMFAEPADFTKVFDLPKVSPARALNVALSTISAAAVQVGRDCPSGMRHRVASDLDRLERMARAMNTAKTWQELLATQ